MRVDERAQIKRGVVEGWWGMGSEGDVDTHTHIHTHTYKHAIYSLK